MELLSIREPVHHAAMNGSEGNGESIRLGSPSMADPDELALLRRMLGRMKGDWLIECADSGPLALQKMFESPFDVVVSNFLMPKMNGAQLFEQVMKHFPEGDRQC